MLRSLTIRDIVLIDALEIEFSGGLNVLTGETGAGKSILLDALGFALGQKGRRDLVRAGAGEGSATAEFVVADTHPVHPVLEAAGLSAPDGDLILRRVASADGRSRGFVNDQRVSADVLARIGAALVEVHGQHDDRGLLDHRGHRGLLDAFGGLDETAAAVRAAWHARREAETALAEARDALEQAASDMDFLRHSVEELDALAPEAGEDALLDAERRLIRQSAELGEELSKAAAALSSDGADAMLGDALSRLTHIASRAEGKLEQTISALDRTMAELTEAQAQLAEVMDALRFDPGRLEVVEERLFAIRGLARKHAVQPDDLPALAESFTARLQQIDAGGDRIAGLEAELAARSRDYDAAAAGLSTARKKAALALNTAVTAELPPLKMENARFEVDMSAADPGPGGIDAVRFTAAINPGAPAGPIDKIASGGELARFLLALKVQLARRSDGMAMIFDEIDRGVGGATANAVGRRLARLADQAQVLVVTHSPQVAAMGQHHFRIAKSLNDDVARTDVELLAQDQREDEVARMLAGDRVTEEARLAARSLLSDAV